MLLNNLCLNENLNNVFLLKFDLKNSIKSNNFRLINEYIKKKFYCYLILNFILMMFFISYIFLF